jgi:hypothetical protein
MIDRSVKKNKILLTSRRDQENINSRRDHDHDMANGCFCITGATQTHREKLVGNQEKINK